MIVKYTVFYIKSHNPHKRLYQNAVRGMASRACMNLEELHEALRLIERNGYTLHRIMDNCGKTIHRGMNV